MAAIKPSKKSQHPKPDAATVLARKDRRACNNLSDNQCESLFNEGMSLIYGAAVKHAPRAGH
jgi:hypothetical protein